ncbi:MAG: ABC transporter ATP-binding protein/permease [Bacilli bacterium]|nr:ABC transporter ATP-binding protein/permease [Bacilli bacterium]MDD4298188.1 ABC transporter ATP-binding protein/permease [Bacilli bacterium]
MLELLHLSKSYKTKKVLDNISFCFDKRDTIYTILGESGTGKTTLFNILYGIDQQFDGEYYLDKKKVNNFTNKDWDRIRSKKIGIVFQDYKLLENLTVYDNLIFSYFLNQKHKQERIQEVLKLMGLEDVSKLKASKLSGGQKQRLAIGRAILNKPQILLLDEPTGNLDDKNTKKIMDYILQIKKESIVIIITHDKRIRNYSDIMVKLENKQLIAENIIEEDNKKKIEKNEEKEYFKPNHIKYLFHSLKSRIIDLVLNNIPIGIIMCIFICIFNTVNLHYNEQLDLLYNGFSDKAIYISSSNYTQKFIDFNREKGITKMDDNTRINFSLDDLTFVKGIKYVTDARLYNSSTISLYDNSHNKLNYLWEKEKMPDQVKKKPSYSSAPSSISFAFNSMNIPYKYAKHFNKVPLLYGDYPRENSNEIVIPDLMAFQYFDNILDSVGKTIYLNTYSQDGNFKDNNYIVSGVYKTDFEKHIKDSYGVYVNYMEEDFLDLFLTTQQYQSMKKTDFENNQSVKNYFNPIYESYENYSKAIGTNLGDLIIIVDDSKNIENVQSKLSRKFPNLKILSQYELKYGESSLAYKEAKTYINLGTLFITLILGIIIIFLNKNYIKTRNRELATLYSLGYSRLYTATIIMLEYVIVTIIDISSAYLILKLLQVFYFGISANYKLFELIFNYSQIIQVILYMFVMIMLSALFSLYGINKRKLRQYLEGNN